MLRVRTAILGFVCPTFRHIWFVFLFDRSGKRMVMTVKNCANLISIQSIEKEGICKICHILSVKIDQIIMWRKAFLNIIPWKILIEYVWSRGIPLYIYLAFNPLNTEVKLFLDFFFCYYFSAAIFSQQANLITHKTFLMINFY